MTGKRSQYPTAHDFKVHDRQRHIWLCEWCGGFAAGFQRPNDEAIAYATPKLALRANKQSQKLRGEHPVPVEKTESGYWVLTETLRQYRELQGSPTTDEEKQ